MTVALLSAMEEEMALYREVCGDIATVTRGPLRLHRTTYAGHALTLVKTGVGKVNAAMATQGVIEAIAPDAVLCTGTAGALHDAIEIGDVVVARDCVQHDLRVDFLGLPPGQVPFTDLRFFETDPSLRARAQAVDLPGHSTQVGRIVTGDLFVQDEAARRTLRDELAGDCVEMEGAAVGQVCTVHEIPFLLLRGISDRADGRSGVDFQTSLEDAAQASARGALAVLRDLETGGGKGDGARQLGTGATDRPQ
ncbi:MAG: 5'-methylthioadenosine/adenosylhomocysteine nucleosidase [Salinibacter sp.]